MKVHAVWFRQDLRTHDHKALFKAQESGLPVIALYVDEPQKTAVYFKHARRSPKRKAYLYATLHDLQQTLALKGIPLFVFQSSLESALAQIQKLYQIEGMHLHRCDGCEESDAVKRLQLAVSCPVVVSEDKTLLDPTTLPFPLISLPASFTAFRKRVESLPIATPLPEIKAQAPLPPAPSVEGTGETFFMGVGEKAAFAHIDHYFEQTHAIKRYKETRNGMLGDDASSKFSVFLAHGSLSVRTLYARLKAFEKAHGANESTYWLYFELLWRDYFSFVSQRYKTALFKAQGLQDKLIPWQNRADYHAAIETAQTGYPLIDANLKMLYETGFMSNRGRQNVASFMTKNLRLDWRYGAALFEHHLLDYDVASNWGNWAYVAGVGNDPQPFRYFDVMNQGRRYDPEGLLCERYLPELHAVPKAQRYLLPSLDPAVYDDYNLNYPKPIVPFRASLLETERYFT